nr:unnamed protein product [Digitaria exilis]
MPASGATQALAMPTAAAHRGGGGDHPRCAHHHLLLERMSPLRPASLGAAAADRRLTRLLVNVTVDGSLWPLHLVLPADATVADLVRAAVAAYVREGRRPPLHQHGGDGFELHFSKYSLESLKPEEKVLDLGSRNFFLCARRSAAADA